MRAMLSAASLDALQFLQGALVLSVHMPDNLVQACWLHMTPKTSPALFSMLGSGSISCCSNKVIAGLF